MLPRLDKTNNDAGNLRLVVILPIWFKFLHPNHKIASEWTHLPYRKWETSHMNGEWSNWLTHVCLLYSSRFSPNMIDRGILKQVNNNFTRLNNHAPWVMWLPFPQLIYIEWWIPKKMPILTGKGGFVHRVTRHQCYSFTIHPFMIATMANTGPHDFKRKPPCIGGTELVSLSCNRVFISAESVGRGWCKIAIATKWYQFHTTDKCGFLFMPWITDQLYICAIHKTSK